jgi:hypothetical protein
MVWVLTAGNGVPAYQVQVSVLEARYFAAVRRLAPASVSLAVSLSC